MNIQAKLLGELKLIQKVRKDAVKVSPELAGAVAYYGSMLNTRIKAKASGRPGPNAPTGDYRRSWAHNVTSENGTTTSTNGTNKPQARRLEFGFSGADSLGRVYDQPPYPHVGPAFDEIRPLFIAAAEKIQRSI